MNSQFSQTSLLIRSTCFPEFWDGPFSHLEEADLKALLVFLSAASHGIPSTSSLNKPKSVLLKPGTVLCCSPSSLSPLDHDPHYFMVTTAKAALDYPIPKQSFLAGEQQTQLCSSPTGCSRTSVKKLYLTPSTNLLDHLSPTMLAFQRVSGKLKSP